MEPAALRDLCLGFAGAVEERPFGPATSVFKVSGKMFALSALEAEPPLKVSLKCDPELVPDLRAAHAAIAPGYHLNKRHWNTVTLDGSLPEGFVRDLVEDSYDLVVSELPRRVRRELGWDGGQGHRPMERFLVNGAADPGAVAAPSAEAAAFHGGLAGYAPTPVRSLDAVAEELGLGARAAQGRVGPARAAGVQGARRVVGDRAGAARGARHAHAGRGERGQPRAGRRATGRARRGLALRVFLPARSVAARREAIASEGAEVVVVDGTYEDAVAQATAAADAPGRLEIADVGDSDPARWVIDGYATLFAEAAEQAASTSCSCRRRRLAGAPRRPGSAPRRACPVIGSSRRPPPASRPRSSDGEPTVIADARHAHGRPRLRGGLASALADAADGIHGTVTVNDARRRRRDARARRRPA